MYISVLGMHKALTISGYAQFEGKMFCSEQIG